MRRHDNPCAQCHAPRSVEREHDVCMTCASRKTVRTANVVLHAFTDPLRRISTKKKGPYGRPMAQRGR